MNLNAYEIVIIAGVVIIIGTLIGIWITYRKALKITRAAEFNKAAAKFKAAFVEAQRYLNPHSLADRASSYSAADIIKNAIGEHEKAMIKFEPFVHKSRIKEYKQAWREYAGDSPHFEQYDGKMLQKREAGRSLALSRINELLKFAEPEHIRQPQ